MAYTGTLCSEAEIAAYAGENVDATGATEANRNNWVAQAESYLCVLSRKNWIDAYSGLNVDVKRILSEYCSRFVAAAEITFNMAGYTSRLEAENMLNIHFLRMAQIEAILGDQKAVTYMLGA